MIKEKKCPYCQLGAEVSEDYVSGHIEINKVKDNYHLFACASQDVFSDKVVFRSVEIHYCPVCGRKLQ